MFHASTITHRANQKIINDKIGVFTTNVRASSFVTITQCFRHVHVLVVTQLVLYNHSLAT